MIEKPLDTPPSITYSVQSPWFYSDPLSDMSHRSIARTLNTQYQHQPYGLGNAQTMYPISAFVTDLVYLKGGAVNVNVDQITVSDPSCNVIRISQSFSGPRC